MYTCVFNIKANWLKMNLFIIFLFVAGIVGIISLFVLIFSREHCPECGKPLSKIRMPKTTREALWGGWTCPYCGCEIDRKGRKVKK
ncbi:MAG: hypothetical protein A3K77_02610 [Euryarchaeota archaeon RBG_13_31_8]|nr:MAG: hypothetical protein A3K77_02610 [Euryarchaeota archaeon RBG_13_31_8]